MQPSYEAQRLFACEQERCTHASEQSDYPRPLGTLRVLDDGTLNKPNYRRLSNRHQGRPPRGQEPATLLGHWERFAFSTMGP